MTSDLLVSYLQLKTDLIAVRDGVGSWDPQLFKAFFDGCILVISCFSRHKLSYLGI